MDLTKSTFMLSDGGKVEIFHNVSDLKLVEGSLRTWLCFTQNATTNSYVEYARKIFPGHFIMGPSEFNNKYVKNGKYTVH